MKAVLKNYRQSPRKVRLIADVVRGQKVEKALSLLQFVEKRAALPFTKVISSALANAKDKGVDVQGLIVKSVSVDKGETYKRFMPRARGSASKINKRNSHITVELGRKGDKVTKK
jgi:large subunit ribosomal protein L22